MPKFTLNLLKTLSAYDNTLTGLIPSLYAGMNIVSREMVGFVPSSFRNASAERAAVGQSVTYPIARSQTAIDITPAMQTPEPADKTMDNDAIVITKARATEFGVTGEEQRGLDSGSGYNDFQAQLFAEGLRTLVNEIEADMAQEAYINAALGYGTAGTTPFGSNISDSAQVLKLLKDKGAPQSGLSLCIDTAAGANLRSLNNLTRANESGTLMTLRDGELLNLNSLSIKESGQTVTHTAGTAASATTNTAGYAKGTTTITLASTGTGTVVAGDYISFAGDANKYLVKTGNTNVATGGTIVLAGSGLMQALPASAVAITVAGDSVRNVAFHQNALHLVARAPALPDEDDMAIDSMMLFDERSGLVFEVRVYPGYRKVRYEVGIAWGVKAAKADHMVGLIG